MSVNLSKAYKDRLKKNLYLLFISKRKDMSEDDSKMIYAKYYEELKKHNPNHVLQTIDWFVTRSTSWYLPQLGEMLNKIRLLKKENKILLLNRSNSKEKNAINLAFSKMRDAING
jgi:hypothetical protein